MQTILFIAVLCVYLRCVFQVQLWQKRLFLKAVRLQFFIYKCFLTFDKLQVNELKCIEESCVYKFLQRIMVRLADDKIVQTFNFTGKRNKKPFKETSTYKLILSKLILFLYSRFYAKLSFLNTQRKIIKYICMYYFLLYN